ncbi:MAG TPA: hypothetical protein PLZ84_08645 [Clostridia bacterium]|nr:hypothetical protein [Clostridia bacterium]
MKPYCTQNNGKCSTCSLANYGLDCNNVPLWGGARKGAGRPPTGRKKHCYYVTDEEDVQIKLLLERLRNRSKDEHA